MIGGKQCEVEAFDPRSRPSPGGAAPMTSRAIDAPKGLRAGVRSYANMVANTEDSLGWTLAGRKNNIGGTCRKCARTRHLERACPQRVKVKHFNCHGCEKLGHFINACLNKAVKGTGIFAQKGCYNCGKHDH